MGEPGETPCRVKTHQRAIVWADGCLELVLKPGVRALWTALRDVSVDVLDARGALLEHEQLAAILALPGTAALPGGGARRPLAAQAAGVAYHLWIQRARS